MYWTLSSYINLFLAGIGIFIIINVLMIKVTDPDGISPLLAAIYALKGPMVQHLIEKGAKADLRGVAGETYAEAWKGEEEIRQTIRRAQVKRTLSF
jgi:hypothetical protein